MSNRKAVDLALERFEAEADAHLVNYNHTSSALLRASANDIRDYINKTEERIKVYELTFLLLLTNGNMNQEQAQIIDRVLNDLEDL